MVLEAAAQATRLARPSESYPLVVVPYLPDEQLRELQSEGVSGIDLCGNGVVVVPGELLVYRTGQPNRFRSESAIKNVFRGESSLIARVFLACPQFDSVQQVLSEIARRDGKVALSTVSKACKALEAMLVIGRRKREGAARPMGLLQADKLLDSLAANAARPVVRQAIRGKARLGQEVLRERLIRAGGVIQSGMSSVGNYAVMAKEAIREYYCTDLDATLLAIGDAFEQTERFADTVLLETQESTAYFDRRADLVASPIQVYLELMLGDKRSRETAEQVRKYILASLKSEGGT